jgi:exosortase A
MPPDVKLLAAPRSVRLPGLAPGWRAPLARLGLSWLALIALASAEWREMVHQWWDIDTYSHILLIPPILCWLVWLRREQLARIVPAAWWPGLVWSALGLAAWLAGHALEVNLLAQTGAVVAMQGAVMALLGLRASLMLAFPLAYGLFLVPFGDEIIAPLQAITARMAVGLTHLSGVPATIDGLFIDTQAGRFVVAEECSGVKFLVAMVALGTLASFTAFRSWPRRVLFVAGAAVVSIFANGVRAWGTIYVAQFVGIERAGGFDHIVYGWLFFAVVIAAVLALGWRFFEREPAEAGLTADQVARLGVTRFERLRIAPDAALAALATLTIGFAALARLV